MCKQIKQYNYYAMRYKEKVLRKEKIILQVPIANIVRSVVKNKSLDEKLFMHP